MAPSSVTSLSTTSYAVLGLLSLRSFTGYELAQQGKRSLAHIWPKEDSVLYEEPRRLVARGLATAREERENGRTRNRYEITDEGREALREWLATKPAPPRFEMEPILRLAYLDQGGVPEALAAVAVMRDWASAHLERGREQLRDHIATGGPFPDRQHITAVVAPLLAGLYETIVEWAVSAEKEISSWDDTHVEGKDMDRLQQMYETLLVDRRER